MVKLYKKDPVWFAVACIGVYVFCFANADTISLHIGVPKLITAAVGLLLTAVLLVFIKSQDLWQHLGLCRVRAKHREMLYFLPLLLITSVNLWGGLDFKLPFSQALLQLLSMCFVAFLEEVIFRGFLFKGLARQNAAAAIAVSSLTFGLGHVVNLLAGATLAATLLQLVYASAIGFCYTAVFLASGSILPAILSHAVVNCSSLFIPNADISFMLITAAGQTVLSLGYGFWLLKSRRKKLFL